MAQGTLFTEDFLNQGICETEAWGSTDDRTIEAFRAELSAILGKIADPSALNEAQTEDRLIRPVLDALGWRGCYSVQERAETKGRANVPDYLFFASVDQFAAADRKTSADKRYPLAVAIGDAKAWSKGLDQRGSGVGADETPSGQILRYLTRADVRSNGKVRWAILTNGRYWRLYFQGARARLEDYFEADIGWLVRLAGTQGDLNAPTRPAFFKTEEAWLSHLFKVLWLVFRRDSFVEGLDGRTFHDLALDEGRNWESRVRESLADVVFGDVFPGLVRALARSDPNRPAELTPTYLGVLREAALTLLYRLLFALYAEDRDLLPKRDSKYDDYGLSGMRDEIAERIDAGDTFSGKRTLFFHHCAELFSAINQGDESIGIPPYNGGLFSDRNDATALLDRAVLPDAEFAPMLDLLARTEKDGRRVRINFRDLSVRQLGSIYERLLEFEPVADSTALEGIQIRLNPFARKGSGSYYTPDELVTLIIDRTVGPLTDERWETFRDRVVTLASDRRPIDQRLTELREIDPAQRILDLKIVDPAMGSGHFLVSLVDYLAERVTTTMGEAHEIVTWGDYFSPLAARLAFVRDRIVAEAKSHHWTIREDQLVDKNLVKRFVLKRCVHGVDKNPMAVELAKVSLWLHTFTAGAPLSFLDHHLKCGDSLFGEWVRPALNQIAQRGALTLADPLRKAEASLAGMVRVEELTDAEIAEVKASANAFRDVEMRTMPLRRFFDFWQALKWLDLSIEEDRALQSLFDGAFGDPLMVAAELSPPQPPAGTVVHAIDPLAESAPEQLTIAGTGVSSVQDYFALKALLGRARLVVAEQRFLHWQTCFSRCLAELDECGTGGRI